MNSSREGILFQWECPNLAYITLQMQNIAKKKILRHLLQQLGRSLCPWQGNDNHKTMGKPHSISRPSLNYHNTSQLPYKGKMHKHLDQPHSLGSRQHQKRKELQSCSLWKRNHKHSGLKKKKKKKKEKTKKYVANEGPRLKPIKTTKWRGDKQSTWKSNWVMIVNIQISG